MQQITWTQECDKCLGRGLYIGMGERDGVAVVCYLCKGTGELHRAVAYTPFTGRRPSPEVVRVFAVNPGIVLTPAAKGGITGVEWYKQSHSAFEPGREAREFFCPAWWYQYADHTKKPDFPECIKIGSFTDCPEFSQKARCWERWDAKEANNG